MVKVCVGMAYTLMHFDQEVYNLKLNPNYKICQTQDALSFCYSEDWTNWKIYN